MKKLIFGLLILLLLPTNAYASTASSTINVNNHTSSSTNSTSNCNTDITTETDGSVTHYQTSDCGNVSVKSENGQTEIKKNGQEVSGNNQTPTLTVSNVPTPIPTEEKEAQSQRAIRENFLQKLFDQLELPFKMFFLKLHLR